MTPVDIDTFDAKTKKLEALWKEQVARRGSEAPNVWRIPWGSPELDWATFRGAPFGRWVRVYGDYSSGKTLVLLNMMRNAQNIHLIVDERNPRLAEIARESGNEDLAKKLEWEREEVLGKFPNGLECVYYNVEGVFDPAYAQLMGIDIDRLRLVEGNQMEKVIDALESYMGAAHVHVLDSTTACVPIRMLKGDSADEQRGVDAARWKDLLRRVETRFDPEANMFAYVSHVTVNQRTQAEQPIGGKKLNFSSSLNLHMKQGKWLYRNSKGILVDKDQASETISGLKNPDGMEITARVAKSRVSPPFRTARLRLDFSRGGAFDVPYEVSEAAKFYGLVDHTQNGWVYPKDADGERTGEKIGQGEWAFREWIGANPDFRERVVGHWMLSDHSRPVEDHDKNDDE